MKKVLKKIVKILCIIGLVIMILCSVLVITLIKNSKGQERQQELMVKTDAELIGTHFYMPRNNAEDVDLNLYLRNDDEKHPYIRAWDYPKIQNRAFRRQAGTPCFFGVYGHRICLLFCKSIRLFPRQFSQVCIHLLCLLFSQIISYTRKNSETRTLSYLKTLTRTFVSAIIMATE